jgi:hypothetical protein
MQRFTSLLLDIYVWFNMFRAPLRPSQRWSWSVVGRGLADHDQQRSNPPLSNGNTRGSWCSGMLLMVGGEAPETC